MEDLLYYNMFQDRLERELLKICTDAGMLEGILLRSDDIDLKWKELAPEYIADGVKEIAAYPTVSVAWAGYIGMAVACWWNRDWNKLKDQPYSVLLGLNGFDDMDDHILKDILGLLPDGKQAQQITSLMQTCAQTAVTFIRQEKIEPQSPRAFYVYARAVQVMFSIGAAIELHRLGYEMRKLQ
ncbi:MAG: hypothetical protein MJY68_09575 [Bacteroidaceae bacterium]|nr:hypothetical protein [Bacteroidaceae bacterium]